MMRPIALALAATWALAGPGSAAGAAAEEESAEAAEPAGPALPASMRQHGVIGFVAPPEGVFILDPAILGAMRDRLIIHVQGGGQ
ncbi:MAG: hypothetical protein ACSHWZ_04335 [Sulfitobacter sp.]